MDYDFKTRLASERQKVEEEFDYEGNNGGESRISKWRQLSIVFGVFVESCELKAE